MSSDPKDAVVDLTPFTKKSMDLKTVTVTRIPAPPAILMGAWHGIVYAIESENATYQEHLKAIDLEIEKLQDDFDKHHHDSVSLRLVKIETPYADADFGRFVSLVQLRVRDSY